MRQARSKLYNAHETSAVEDFAVAMLCGDVEFKVRVFTLLRCLQAKLVYYRQS
jgi:hypothetical protein